jgi:hypothetical protein
MKTTTAPAQPSKASVLAAILAAIRAAYNTSKADCLAAQAAHGNPIAADYPRTGPYVTAAVETCDVHVRYAEVLPSRGVNRQASFKAIVGDRKTGWARSSDLDALADHVIGKRSWF